MTPQPMTGSTELGINPLWNILSLSRRPDWVEYVCNRQDLLPFNHFHLMTLHYVLLKTQSFSIALNSALKYFHYATVSMGNYIQIKFRHYEYFFKYEKSNNWEKFNVKWVNANVISFWFTLRNPDKCQLLPWLRWERQRNLWSCHRARVSPNDLDDSSWFSLWFSILTP